MLEDIRNHDAAPTAEESAWMATDAVGLTVRAVMLAGVALAIGVSVSVLLDEPRLEPSVVAVSQK